MYAWIIIGYLNFQVYKKTNINKGGFRFFKKFCLFLPLFGIIEMLLHQKFGIIFVKTYALYIS